MIKQVLYLCNKENKKYLYLMVLFLILIFFLLSYILITKNKVQFPNFSEIKKSNVPSKIIYDTSPILFAKVENQNLGYYFVIDKDNIVSIVLMELDKSYENTIVGVSNVISEDLKKVSIDFYNKNVKDVLTNDNFYTYLSRYYLDVTKEVGNLNIYYYFLIGLIIMFILSLFVYIKNILVTKNTINKTAKFNARMENNLKKASLYKALKVIITDEYLFLYKDGLKILEFNDIIYIYEDITKRHILRIKDSMILYTNDKSYTIIGFDKLKKKDGLSSLEFLKKFKTKCHNLVKKDRFCEEF